MNIQHIISEKAPKPLGHYAHSVVHNGIVYVSGQLPIDPVSGTIVNGEIEQIDQVFSNLAAVLNSSGSDWLQVLSMTVFLAKKDLWSIVNTKCKDVFGSYLPSRTIVPEVGLKEGVLIEVSLIAAIRGLA